MFGQSFYNNPYQSRQYAPAKQAWYPPADPGWLRALADQRKRRRQWLPDEDDDSEEEWEYNQLRPQERLYLDARKRQEKLERKEQEEQLARERALQELYREQANDATKRNQVLEEHRMRQQLKRDEPARPKSASTHSQWQSGQIDVESPPRTSHRPPFLQAEYTERHHEAASRIQQQYRIHRSFHTIRNLESQFKTLKQSFIFPSSIDFHSSGRQNGVLTVPIEHSSPGTRTEVSADEVIDAKLAYTPGNHALHAYTDAMDKLLMKLDGVESWGDEEVRKRRRDVVKMIEEEASRVEQSWMSAWKLYFNDVNERKEID